MGLMGPPPFISSSIVPAPSTLAWAAWGDPGGAPAWTPGIEEPS